VIRVLVADDHLAVREGLHALLAKEREMAIVGEAGDGSTALELARRLKPDLIVLDDSMPGIGSLDVARTILAELPSTAVVFLARDPGMRDLALAAGATAFVSKDAPSEELLRALRASAAAVTARQQLSALRPEGRRVVELLLGSRVMTGEQVQQALANRASRDQRADRSDRIAHVFATTDRPGRARGGAFGSLRRRPRPRCGRHRGRPRARGRRDGRSAG